MYAKRRISWKLVAAIGGRVAGLGAAWAGLVYFLYAVVGLSFLRVPFLPVATIGTAVAFYIGFKNNSAYERFWEGRKIWGGIVNASRTWATMVISYVHPGDDAPGSVENRRELIYRQIAWVNAVRLQLRRTSRFFDKPAPGTRRRLDKHADAMRNDWDKELSPLLPAEELAEVSERKNPATHMLTRQGTELAELHRGGHLDLFRQLDLMSTIRELYTLQGKCERIKGTPFPRQYAEMSRWFTRVFVFLVPFGLLDVFAGYIAEATTRAQSIAPVVTMLLASGLVSWVFVTMEGVGDSSEDPFERSINDVPMNAICRTIEIDLREILGETDLPPKEPVFDDILY